MRAVFGSEYDLRKLLHGLFVVAMKEGSIAAQGIDDLDFAAQYINFSGKGCDTLGVGSLVADVAFDLNGLVLNDDLPD